MGNRKWKRRDFLRNSVMAGMLAPVAMYWDDLAEAQGMMDRRNMVLFFLPNGKVASNDYILGDGMGYSLAYGYEPYMPFKNDMIIFDQYGFQSFIREEYDGDHAGHVAPGAVMYSGEVPYTTSAGAGEDMMAPSIDQIVAWDYIDRGVIRDPLRKSMNIKVTGSSFRLDSMFCDTPADYTLGATYTRALSPVSQHGQPQSGFEQMFGDFAAMGGGTVGNLWDFGKSVLDVPNAELRSVRPQLPIEGQRIVDEHLQSLRELELSFADEPPPAGEIPPPPGSMDTAPTNHANVWSQWVQIIDAAFRFDRTRIVNVQFGGTASRFNIPSLGLGFVGESGDSNSGSDHHSYTHWDESNVPHFMNWYAERITELLGAMKAEGTGRENLLDRGVVSVGMEFGRNHNASDMPVMLFGSLGGYLRPGQRIAFGNEIENYHKHTGMLLALAHGMGTTRLTEIGNRRSGQYQQGVFSELLAG
ncbi:MAG: DUF1552 domain-containing protein [Myxococcota bacterium]